MKLLLKAAVMAGAAASLALLAACSEREKEPPQDAPGNGEPVSSGPPIADAPLARLKDSSGSEVVAPAGSRCWGTSCVDMIGPLTLPNATKVKAGARLAVSYDAGSPTVVEYTWMSGPLTPAPVRGGHVAWQPTQNTQKASIPIEAPGSPGDYLLIAFARWDGKGDISYAWYLKVE